MILIGLLPISMAPASSRSLSSQQLPALQGLPPDVATLALTVLVLLCSVTLSTTARAADAERIITCGLLVLGFVALPIGAALSVFCPPAFVSAPSSVLLALGSPRLAADVSRVTTSYCAASGVAAQCTVCLDDVTEGQSARALPCGHEFHRSCVDSWLLMAQRNACPLCARPVIDDRDGNMESVPATLPLSTSGTPCRRRR